MNERGRSGHGMEWHGLVVYIYTFLEPKKPGLLYSQYKG